MDLLLSFAWKAAVGVAALYLLLGGALFAFQRRLIYHPEPTRIAPASIGLSTVAEIEIGTADAETIIGWYGAAPLGRKTILYFHGNAGGLADRIERILAYRSDGLGMLIVSYRGFSGSTGSPSERANVADATAAYGWLRRQGVAARDIVLFGESLGTGVAVQLAATHEVAGIILDAPYTSLAEIGQAQYPWLPVKALMLDPYRSIDHIAKVRAPLLIMHGARDEVVPVEMGRRIFAAANQPKRLVEFPEGGHVYHGQFGSLDLVPDFVNTLP